MHQQTPSVGQFDQNASAPPPYSLVSQDYPTTQTPAMGQPAASYIQSPMQQQPQQPQQQSYPQEKAQYVPQVQQQPGMAAPQQFQPMGAPQQQFQPMVAPQMMQPGMQQQPMRYPPNMTPDQQQQLQKIVQNMPPEKLQAIQQQAQQMMPQQQMMPPPQPYVPPPMIQPQQPSFVQTKPSGLFGKSSSSQPQIQGMRPPEAKDEKQTGKVQRFFGDTLVGRVARSSVATASSTLKLPTALSPWGDNNPVTLPNVRYRDAVLFTTFAFVGAPLVEGADGLVSGIFGADSFVSEIVSSGAGAIVGSTVLKYGVFQIVEQAIDKGVLEHMLPEEEKMVQTTTVKSMQVGIKHKLMGVDADLRFSGIYPARSSQACEKGWFCPYLFASARTPSIPRCNDFAIAQFFGPFVGADYAMAHKLVSESTHLLSLCDPDPTHDLRTNRMVILFTGISPYRANMWSTSRRPGCGTIVFHILDGCPAIVLPVTARAPIVAWSPWTLSQMRQGEYGAHGYSAYAHHEQVCEWLDSIVSMEHLRSEVREKYVEVLGRSVSLIINGALALDRVDKTILGKLDPERAGIVAFRY